MLNYFDAKFEIGMETISAVVGSCRWQRDFSPRVARLCASRDSFCCKISLWRKEHLMQKWEYLRLDVHYKEPKDPGVQSIFSNYDEILSEVTFQELQSHINKLGGEGWEMVVERASGERHHAFYFKRPVIKKSKKKSKKKKNA
jgi:hypothetical protein